MIRWERILLSLVSLSLILLWGATEHVLAREIVDMAGRRVRVPDVIKTAYAPSPYGFTMLYSVAPEKLAGLMSPLKAEDRRYLHPVIYENPVIGRLQNVEALKKAKPDIIIVWGDKKNPIHKPSEEALAKLGIPYVYVTVGNLADLSDYPAAYEFLGKLLGKEDHTSQQSAYCRNTLHEVEAAVGKTSKQRRPRVYLAEGKDGLRTECDDSLHVHLLKLAGDLDVHRCRTCCHKGYEPVTLEQVSAYNPDVIIAQDRSFFENVRTDPAWDKIKAVKQGRVYLIPKQPFNWFDRPPSFMRILGLKWLMNRLYPDACRIDLTGETVAFFKLFLGVDITPEEAEKLLRP